jgi:hypothetical protein
MRSNKEASVTNKDTTILDGCGYLIFLAIALFCIAVAVYYTVSPTHPVTVLPAGVAAPDDTIDRIPLQVLWLPISAPAGFDVSCFGRAAYNTGPGTTNTIYLLTDNNAQTVCISNSDKLP